MKKLIGKLAAIRDKVLYVNRTVVNEAVENGNSKTVYFVLRSDLMSLNIEHEKTITTTFG